MDAAKIEEVIGDCLGNYDRNNLSGLKKTGIRYKALCPFHEDRSMGSFIVYPKGNCYKCFACGAKGGVIEFLMEYEKLSYPDALRWLGKKYNIDVDDVKVNWTYTPRPAPPPLKMLELPSDMVDRTYKAIWQGETIVDNLVKWMFTGINWDYVQRKRLAENIHNYHVGHGKNGHTIFWQIDEHEKVRTGKMMKYYPEGHPKFGHRDKDSKWNFDFIHSTLSRRWDEEHHMMVEEPPYPFPHLFDPDKQEPCLTFFGMHLLNFYPKATINIVESEKTALLMATAYGNHATQVWMACGGLEMLSRERMKPIIDQGRKVVLYPDRDGIAKWKAKAKQIGYDQIHVDTDPVLKWWRPEDGDKADIADVVVRILNDRKPMTSIDEVKEAMPIATKLIDKLNLQVEK